MLGAGCLGKQKPSTYILWAPDTIMTVSVRHLCLLQVIWNNKMREEVLSQMEVERREATAGTPASAPGYLSAAEPGTGATAAGSPTTATGFKFAALGQELVVAGVFVRVYNEQANFPVADPAAFCKGLVTHIHGHMKPEVNLCRLLHSTTAPCSMWYPSSACVRYLCACMQQRLRMMQSKCRDGQGNSVLRCTSFTPWLQSYCTLSDPVPHQSPPRTPTCT